MSFGRPTLLGRANHSYSHSANGLIKIILFAFAQASHALVIPLAQYYGLTNEDSPTDEGLNVWLYLVIAAILVLAGGAFAGLTIALMGQDGIYLQVIATSGEGTQQRHAQSVHKLLQRGKHWVLVTLLLSNVIVNETLPIVLDRSLGGGWPAVLGSTVLIVIFGEVIPQSVCVRYGLSIGAFMAPCVIGLMWILAPIAWPIAKLLDKLLGKDHGTVYKKSGLKTLVTLHKTLGASPTERLNQDEVTIISAVLDLKDKAVGDIMTPMENVFTMSEDTVLNVETMNTILSAGYSRIPIYEPGNPNNFVGMLLVKILITYDPEDCKKVSEFALATLPETRPETSCLDIVNFFQEGKSHMVLVSEFPAENYGAIGVVTLEDVIEELIGEEIIDESDVYIDVQKAIRRLAPAPKARSQKHHVVDSDNFSNQSPLKNLSKDSENTEDLTSRDRSGNLINQTHAASNQVEASSNIALIRKGSEVFEGNHISVRRDPPDVREHLKHLGPSNLASRPKSTRYSTVKIKSAYLQPRSISNGALGISCDINPSDLISDTIVEELNTGGSETDKLISHLRGNEAMPQNLSDVKKKPSVEVNLPGYGSLGSFKLSKEPEPTTEDAVEGGSSISNHKRFKCSLSRSFSGHTSSPSSDGSDLINSPNSKSTSSSNFATRKKRAVLSGSITENIIEAGGIRKLVLETNSSGEEPEQLESVVCTQQDEEARTEFEDLEDMQDESSQQNGNDQQTSLSHQSKRTGGKKKRRKNNRNKKCT